MEKKELQNKKQYKKLNEDNDPQLLPNRHVPETVVIEKEYSHE